METSAIGATYAIDDSEKALNLKMTTYVEYVNTHHTNTDESNNIEYNMRHDYNNWKSLLDIRKYITWIKHLLGDNVATSDVINNSQRGVNGTHGGN
jgi:hypothetical protein